MRTYTLASLLLLTGACAHTQAQNPDAALLSASSHNATPATGESCLHDDDALDPAACPVQGAPVEQEVTRMTSLLQSRAETMSTADATPMAAPQQDVDDLAPAPSAVAEDAP